MKCIDISIVRSCTSCLDLPYPNSLKLNCVSCCRPGRQICWFLLFHDHPQGFQGNLVILGWIHLTLTCSQHPMYEIGKTISASNEARVTQQQLGVCCGLPKVLKSCINLIVLMMQQQFSIYSIGGKCNHTDAHCPPQSSQSHLCSARLRTEVYGCLLRSYDVFHNHPVMLHLAPVAYSRHPPSLDPDCAHNCE